MGRIRNILMIINEKRHNELKINYIFIACYAHSSFPLPCTKKPCTAWSPADQEAVPKHNSASSEQN
jgi:hypothetical protein